jgi:IS30 family transposase
MEFAQYQSLPSKTFFCDPYSSWKKGDIEHTNGRIRRWLPKNYNGHIAQNMLDNIANILSNKQKILNCKTPTQIFKRCTSI